jgi:hypothetical protein
MQTGHGSMTKAIIMLPTPRKKNIMQDKQAEQHQTHLAQPASHTLNDSLSLAKILNATAIEGEPMETSSLRLLPSADLLGLSDWIVTLPEC